MGIDKFIVDDSFSLSGVALIRVGLIHVHPTKVGHHQQGHPLPTEGEWKILHKKVGTFYLLPLSVC